MARSTFFSFHYKSDVWRAWNVRNSWVVKPGEQEDIGFFDRSVVEEVQKKGDDNLKEFLRNGLRSTSVTCILAGKETWARRWVRYEIVRSILKGNGLLTVYIHNVKNQEEQMTTQGPNPLDNIGLYMAGTSIYFAEWKEGRWVKYADYGLSVDSSDLWFAAPSSNSVVQLSKYCNSYDFINDDGRSNIAAWIELAAQNAGW